MDCWWYPEWERASQAWRGKWKSARTMLMGNNVIDIIACWQLWRICHCDWLGHQYPLFPSHQTRPLAAHSDVILNEFTQIIGGNVCTFQLLLFAMHGCACLRVCGCVCIVPVAHKEPMVNTIWIVEVVGSCGWMGSNQCVGMRKQQYLMPLIFYYYYSSLPGKDAEQCETKLILCVSALLPGYRIHGIKCKHNNRQWTRQRKRERGGDRNIVS